MSNSQRPFWRWFSTWFPVAVAVALLAFESQEIFSVAHTNGPFRTLYENIFGPVSDWDWGGIHAKIRKSGHVAGFAFVGITLFRAWFLTFRERWANRAQAWSGSAGLAILCSIALASADEFHQRFLPGRGSSVRDVLIDTSGATLALLLAGLYFCFRQWPGSPIPVSEFSEPS